MESSGVAQQARTLSAPVPRDPQTPTFAEATETAERSGVHFIVPTDNRRSIPSSASHQKFAQLSPPLVLLTLRHVAAPGDATLHVALVRTYLLLSEPSQTVTYESQHLLTLAAHSNLS